MKRFLIPALAFVFVALSACAPAPPPRSTAAVSPLKSSRPLPSETPGVTPLMGRSVFTAAELTAWYNKKSKEVVKDSTTCAPVGRLAQLFLDEGSRENVRGDLAFIQAMVETGWLGHSERVPGYFCNYAGIGAVDSGTGANRFPNATMGVRAQIHHLRAYADKTTTCKNFSTTNASPRCHLVSPKGKAPTWEQMGSGNWASDPKYSSTILGLYANLKGSVKR